MRGLIHFWQTSATAVGDGFFGAFGIGIASVDAFNVGVSAIPSPLEDLNWPGWLWHSFYDTRQLSTTAADGVNAGVTHSRIEVDSKAMRKLRLNEVLFGAIDQVESGTASAEFNAEVRVLVKLP